MDNQPQPTKPSNKTPWIVLVIVILAIAGYGIYAYVSGQNNENTNNTNTSINQNANVTANTNVALNTNISVNTNTAVNTNTSANTNTLDTTGWKTYENVELGFSFNYPAELGEVIFTITNGTTGRKFKGAFSQNNAIVFGGDTSDYSFPSEAGFTDTYGYTQKDSQYFMYLPTASREHQVSIIKKISNTTANGIILTTKMYDMDVTGAIFNLDDDVFPGIGFLLKDEQKISMTKFEQIMSTLKAD